MAQRVEGLLPASTTTGWPTTRSRRSSRRTRPSTCTTPRRQWGFPTEAAFYLVVSAVLDRTLTKYLERGYRFVLMEAGMVGYSATLLAECQGIRSCMMGGWLDRELERRLELDGYHESVVHVVCFGRPPLPEDA